MNAQCFWLSSQSGQTQITIGQKHWCCAGGRRWCGAGSSSALMVLLCVWCVAGIGARAHRVSDEERFLWFYTAAPKVGPHARACAHTRPRHRRGVGERPHVRWSVERTASLAVAKPRCSGGQTRWTCELSGLCKVYSPKGGQRKVQSYFDQSCGSIRRQLYSVLPTLLWPYSSNVYLVLATALFFSR